MLDQNTIQLTRQGSTHTLNANFRPCPHGVYHHLQLQDYQGRGFIGYIHAPNCFDCPTDANRHRGQTIWSSISPGLKVDRLMSMDELRAEVLAALPGMTFSPVIETYGYLSAWDLEHYPFTKTDVYLTCARYESETDTIRHEPTNICLIAFKGPLAADMTVDAAAAPYADEVAKAYTEFAKQHVQRGGEYDAKRWCAWLLGQYIRKMPGQAPVQLKRIDTRRGQ